MIGGLDAGVNVRADGPVGRFRGGRGGLGGHKFVLDDIVRLVRDGWSEDAQASLQRRGRVTQELEATVECELVYWGLAALPGQRHRRDWPIRGVKHRDCN